VNCSETYTVVKETKLLIVFHVNSEDKKNLIVIFSRNPWNILRTPKGFENHRLGTTGIKKQSSPDTRHGGAWGERRYSSYSFSTSALDGGEWSASLPRETIPGTHCTGGWVGLRAGLDTDVRGKILCPCQGSNSDRPVVQSVVRFYTDRATPAPNHCYRSCLMRVRCR
jgi:hypothetical protein